MSEESLDPGRTCLLFFDCSNLFVNGPTLDKQNRSDAMSAALKNWQRQVEAARRLGMMVAYANAVSRPDRADSFERRADMDFQNNPIPRGERLPPSGFLAFGSPQVQVVDEIAPRPEDYMIWKPRWNPFFQTALELSMRRRGIESIVLNGGSTEVGIAATVYAVQALDFHLITVSDGCTSRRTAVADGLMSTVFRLLGRVRTTDEVLTMLEAGAAAPGV